MQKKLLSKQQASEIIAKHIAKAEAEIAAAEELAKEHELSFSWDGPAYGMGGRYTGIAYSNYDDEKPEHWHASSQSC